MTTRLHDVLLEGDHASLPAATAVAKGTLYSCTDHGLIYQSDRIVWSTWAALGGSGGGGGDVPPGGVNDDEFDGDLADWTTFGTLTSYDVDSTVPSHLYIRRAAITGDHLAGLSKPTPAAPFTATVKMSDALAYANYNRSGVFVSTATPGQFVGLVFGYSTTLKIGRIAGSALSGVSMSLDNAFDTVRLAGPLYMKIKATSSTAVELSVSLTGTGWYPIWSGATGFTIGSIGLYTQSHNSTFATEAFFDWIRFE